MRLRSSSCVRSRCSDNARNDFSEFCNRRSAVRLSATSFSNACCACLLSVKSRVTFPKPTNFPASSLRAVRSEEHTSELQSRLHLVCRLLLEKKKKFIEYNNIYRSSYY